MSVLVVDLLEAVEVAVEQREAAAAFGRETLERPSGVDEELAPVGESGERGVQGLVVDLGFVAGPSERGSEDAGQPLCVVPERVVLVRVTRLGPLQDEHAGQAVADSHREDEL